MSAVRNAENERLLARTFIQGTVVQRDHQKGVRLNIGLDADGQPVLSSWVQPPDQNGPTRSRWLPAIGSQHLLITVPGSEEATTILPLTHFDDHPNPAANADETVFFDDGTSRISIGGGKITIKAGDDKIVIGGGKIEIYGNDVTVHGAHLNHNEKSVGDTHKHGGVETGGGITDNPV